MKIKLKNTKLMDEYKRPILFFHTSPVEKIERFLPLSHFGTKRAADMRSIHFIYKILGIPEPTVLSDKIPDNIQKKISKLENAPELFTYPVYLYSKSAIKIPDFGRHALFQYQKWFRDKYAPKAKFLTGKERLEGDGVGETKTAYKKALTEFIFVDPFIENEENLKKELSADSLFSPTADALAEKVALGRMIRFLEGEGYDSFIYKNDYEDKGKESYIIFRPEQVFMSTETEHILPNQNTAFLIQQEKKFFKKKGILSPSERIANLLCLKQSKMR